MIKSIKLPVNRADKIDILTKICFDPISDSELRLLKVLIDFSTNNSITLTQEVSKQVLEAAAIGQSLFNTSIHRLQKKCILIANGKTKTLHPIYNNINDWDKLLLNLSNE